VCFLGLTALLLALVPLVAILPILLYIGLVIGAQAFQATPSNHAPAVVLAIIPNLAEWAKTQIDGALAAAGTSVAEVGLDKLAGTGVLYRGLELLGGGSVLAGMVLGAMAAFIIEKRLKTAAFTAFIGAALSYIGLIHGTHLGLGVSPPDVSWGLLVNEGTQVITPIKIYWWLVVFSGMTLARLCALTASATMADKSAREGAGALPPNAESKRSPRHGRARNQSARAPTPQHGASRVRSRRESLQREQLLHGIHRRSLGRASAGCAVSGITPLVRRGRGATCVEKPSVRSRMEYPRK
jgi:hypothetical protein